jgi:hypothetical protein
MKLTHGDLPDAKANRRDRSNKKGGGLAATLLGVQRIPLALWFR